MYSFSFILIRLSCEHSIVHMASFHGGLGMGLFLAVSVFKWEFLTWSVKINHVGMKVEVSVCVKVHGQYVCGNL